MRTELENKGIEHARYVLETTRDNVEQACEDCGEVGQTYYGGTASTCRACFAESIRYWEKRGGFSSENIFEYWIGMPKESSRVYRVTMSAYFRELAGKS